jgi:hypothetical protein
MPVSGSQMGQGVSGTNPPGKYSKNSNGAKLLSAISPLRKKKSKKKRKRTK